MVDKLTRLKSDGERAPRLAAAPVSRRRHVEMLVIASIAIVASFLLQVGPAERVHVTSLPSALVPKLCMSRELFGTECPGCGLTRSFIHLAHFDWQSAWEVHRLGWLLFAATLFQLPYRAQALLGKNGSLVPLSVAKAFGTVLIVLLLVNWLAGLVMVDVFAGN